MKLNILHLTQPISLFIFPALSLPFFLASELSANIRIAAPDPAAKEKAFVKSEDIVGIDKIGRAICKEGFKFRGVRADHEPVFIITKAYHHF